MEVDAGVVGGDAAAEGFDEGRAGVAVQDEGEGLFGVEAGALDHGEDLAEGGGLDAADEVVDQFKRCAGTVGAKV